MDITACYNCQKAIPSDSAILVQITTAVSQPCCQDCVREVETCYKCEKVTVEDLLYSVVDNGNYCRNCRVNNCFSCDDCSLYFLDENEQNCYNCESAFCQSCYDYHECNENYDDEDVEEREVTATFPTCEVRGKILKINRFAGVEIEAEGGTRYGLYDLLSADYGIENDGSLENGGIEIQTPPLTMKDFEKSIIEATTTLKNEDFQATTRCGLHCHVDFREYRKDFPKIAKLFKTIYAIEDIIYAYINKSRSDNTFCIPLNKSYKFSDIKTKISRRALLKKYYKKKYIREIEKEFNDKSASVRYNGLNLHSIMYRGTIEFRYHEGTLDENEIMQWVNFLLHIVNYVIKDYKLAEILTLHKTKNKRKKLELLFKYFKIPKKLQKHIKAKIRKEHGGFLRAKKKSHKGKLV